MCFVKQDSKLVFYESGPNKSTVDYMLVRNQDKKIITLHAKLSSTVYCNRSCVFVCGFVCLWVSYHDNSKLHASIFTKLGL